MSGPQPTSFPKLTPFMEDLITKSGSQQMGLSQKGITQLKKCISRYTTGSSFSQKISWALFRTWHAVKALFGESYWDQTKRTCAKAQTREFAQEKIREKCPSASQETKERILRLPSIKKFTRKTNELGMKFLLKANEKKANSQQEAIKIQQKLLTQEKKQQLDKLEEKIDKDILSICRP